LRIEGVPEVPDWRPSPMQGSENTPRRMRAAGRLHVHHLGRARIADGPRPAHHQDGASSISSAGSSMLWW
jgi:hypothetical protein